MFIPSARGAGCIDGWGDHRAPRSAPLPASPRWGKVPGSLPRRGRVRERAGTVPAEPWRGRGARASGPCASGGVRHAHDRLAWPWGNQVPPYPRFHFIGRCAARRHGRL